MEKINSSFTFLKFDLDVISYFVIILFLMAAFPNFSAGNEDLGALENQMMTHYQKASDGLKETKYEEAKENFIKANEIAQRLLKLSPASNNDSEFKKFIEDVQIGLADSCRFLVKSKKGDKDENFSKAIKNYSEAVKNNYLGERNTIIIFAGELLDFMGVWLRDEGNLEKSRVCFELSKEIWLGKPINLNMGELSSSKETFQLPAISKEKFNEKLSEFKKRALQEDANLAYVFMETGEIQRAIGILKNAQRTGIDKGIDYLNLGKCYYLLGLFKDSEKAYGEASKIFQSDKEQNAYMDLVKINKGLLLFDQGYYDDAMLQFEDVLTNSAKKENKIFASNNLGAIYFNKYKEVNDESNFNKAEEYLKRAKTDLSKIANFSKSEACKYDLNLGILYYRRAKYSKNKDEKEKYIDDAKKSYGIDSKFNPDPGKIKEIPLIRSLYYANLGDIILLEATPLNKKEEIEVALGFYKKALDEALKLESREQLWNAYYGLGQVYKIQGNFEEAIKNYKNSIETIESMRNLLTGSGSIGFLRNKHQVYTDLIDLLLERWESEKDEAKKNEYSKSAFEYLERSRMGAIKSLFEQALPKEKQEISQKIAELDLQLTFLAQKKANAEDKEKSKLLEEKINKLKVEKETLDAKLSEGDPSIQKPEISLQKIRESIAADQVILSFYYNKENIYIWKIEKKTDFPFLGKISRKEYSNSGEKENIDIIDDKVRPTYLYISKPKMLLKFKKNVHDNLKLLFTRFFLESKIDINVSDIKAITIIPYGELSKLPFSVLINEKGDRLNNLFRINYEFSLAKGMIKSKGDNSFKLLAVGNPEMPVFIEKSNSNASDDKSAVRGADIKITPDNLSSIKFIEAKNIIQKIIMPKSDTSKTDLASSETRGGSGIGFEPLEAAGKEVETIGNNFLNKKNTKPTILKNSLIGEWTVKKEFLNNYSYIHLATHGKLNPYSPLYSFLVFSKDPKEKEDSENSGLLTVKEIRRDYFAKLVNTKLVVLSACETALGGENNGIELSSLSGAFQSAGVSAVIASLWEVPSEATFHLMDYFYNHLFEGHSVSESLRQAANDLRKEEGGEKYDEFSWSPFILLGSDYIPTQP